MIASKVSNIGPEHGAELLRRDPIALFDGSHTLMQTTDRDNLSQLQLAAAQSRFADLRDAIPVLKKLCDKLNISTIHAIEDLAPILFDHTMYKSYPASLLDKARFSDLNRWLSRLSIHDLTGIDVQDCRSIDDWLEVMDRESPLTIIHSSGTTGTMSLLPTGKDDFDLWGKTWASTVLQRFGAPIFAADEEIWAVYPYYRHGGSAHLRFNDNIVKHAVGSEDRLLTAYAGRMSSDLLHLSGRIRAAQTRGDLDQLIISPKLEARKAEYENIQADMAAHMAVFFDNVATRLKGKRVFMTGTWNLLYNMAKTGLANGLEGVFAPNSAVVSGGGAKNLDPPADWKEVTERFLGAPIQMSYGMSELHGSCFQCDNGNFHFPPWIIPFLLDPDNGELLSRKGTVTGRGAFFDLTIGSRWGGFISGDKLTIDWDEPCGCGRTSHYIVGEIRRYSELQGGDDKITCAATESAHREAMDFLNAADR